MEAGYETREERQERIARENKAKEAKDTNNQSGDKNGEEKQPEDIIEATIVEPEVL